MKLVSYTDSVGRKFMVSLPDNAPESDAGFGLPIGPPVLESLELPRDIEIRLNNELFARGLFTLSDLKGRNNDVLSALLNALSVSVGRITEAYRDGQSS